MKVFLYEFITGGGLWSVGSEPADDALLAEGRCMIRAVAADFAALNGVKVVTTRDMRLPELHPAGCRVIPVESSQAEREILAKQARQADWTLLIAPEIGGALLDRCQLVERAGGRLLSPPSSVVAIASDKHATAELLSQAGVPVPRGIMIGPEGSWGCMEATPAQSRAGGWGCMDATPARCRSPAGPAGPTATPAPLTFPAVLKPTDGCGSLSLLRIDRPDDIPWQSIRQPMRLEEFIPGLAASVAVLCGPDRYFCLPACQQLLSTDGRFSYLGGRLPLAPSLDARARRLAKAAVRALGWLWVAQRTTAGWGCLHAPPDTHVRAPEARGYLGVDLVLGEADDGSLDRVIEINPRITTSYVALRAASETNLASAMLAIAAGDHPDLRWRCNLIEFTADGGVELLRE